MHPFFYYQSGSVTLGVYPWFRLFIDWRDPADGFTLIRPSIRFVNAREWRR